MIDHVEPRNRAERRAASRRTRKVAALGSGAILAMGVAGTATTLLSAAPAGAAAPIVVDSLTDDGTGTTLRDAITQANADTRGLTSSPSRPDSPGPSPSRPTSRTSPRRSTSRVRVRR